PGLMRQGIGVHAEARVDGENADGDSCSALARSRWRAKQELRGREPFDHMHGSAEDVVFSKPPSSRKHSGNSVARFRLARKPKLRMRTKPGGSRWSRKRRRNSSTGRVMSRFLLPRAARA